LKQQVLQAASSAAKQAVSQAVTKFKPLQTLGGYAGPMGAALGKLADSKIHKLFGKGVYMVGRGSYDIEPGPDTIMNDTFKDVGHRFHMGSFKNDDNSKIIICGSEMVTQIAATGTAGDTCQSFSVNPGLRSIFPWLSQIAPNFSEYECHQLVYEYQPVVSNTSVSSVGSLGNVAMGVNYNAGAAKYTTFPQIMNSEHSVRGTIADKILCGIECDPSKNVNRSSLYTRTGAVPSNQDIKTYDLAKFQVMLSGVPTAYTAGTILGNLVVHYCFSLSKKVFFDGMGFNILMDQFWSNTTATGMTYLIPFGTAALKNSKNSIGSTLTIVSGAQRVTLPDDFVGSLRLFMKVDGTGIGTVPTFTTNGNISLLLEMINPAVPSDQSGTSTTNGTLSTIAVYYTVTAPALTTGNNYFVIQSATAAPTTLTGCYFEMIMINPNNALPSTNAVSV